MSTLGDRIRKLRKSKNLTQEELAAHIHINRATLANWEINRAAPDIETLQLLAEFFKVSTDYLLCLTDNPHPVDKAKEPDLDAPLRQKSLAEALYKISELIWEFDLDSETRRKLIDKAVAKFGPPPHMEKGGIAAHGPSVPGTGIFDKEDDDD